MKRSRNGVRAERMDQLKRQVVLLQCILGALVVRSGGRVRVSSEEINRSRGLPAAMQTTEAGVIIEVAKPMVEPVRSIKDLN